MDGVLGSSLFPTPQPATQMNPNFGGDISNILAMSVFNISINRGISMVLFSS